MTPDAMCWRWSVASGVVSLTFPREPVPDADLDDVEELMRLAMRTLRRAAKPEEPDYVI